MFNQVVCGRCGKNFFIGEHKRFEPSICDECLASKKYTQFVTTYQFIEEGEDYDDCAYKLKKHFEETKEAPLISACKKDCYFVILEIDTEGEIIIRKGTPNII